MIGPERQRIELQIRTHEMHEVAELGVAAHWVYKQSVSPRTEGRQYRWLRELLDILEHASDPQEFLEHTKLEMFQDQVFCFTPKGDLIELPRGSTPVDFAYAVHSEIGDSCVGAKVNGKLVPLRTQLVNGDQVEVVTSKAQTPSPTWERFVVTGKARARIRRFVRTQQRQQYLDLGKAILQKAFRQEGHDHEREIARHRPRHVQLRERPRISTSPSAKGCTPVARSSIRFTRPRPTRKSARWCRWRRRAARRRPKTPCRFAASFPAWRCTMPAAATPCRAIGSSASSTPARA